MKTFLLFAALLAAQVTLAQGQTQVAGGNVSVGSGQEGAGLVLEPRAVNAPALGNGLPGLGSIRLQFPNGSKPENHGVRVWGCAWDSNGNPRERSCQILSTIDHAETGRESGGLKAGKRYLVEITHPDDSELGILYPDFVEVKSNMRTVISILPVQLPTFGTGSFYRIYNDHSVPKQLQVYATLKYGICQFISCQTSFAANLNLLRDNIFGGVVQLRASPGFYLDSLIGLGGGTIYLPPGNYAYSVGQDPEISQGLVVK